MERLPLLRRHMYGQLSKLHGSKARRLPFSYLREGATPEAFGAGAARGLASLGAGLSSFANSLHQIAVQEQEIELKGLDVEFSNRVRDLMYGNPEEKTPGYLSTQNQDAVDGHVPLRQKIAEVREELLGSASSGRVRDRFTVAASQRVSAAYTQAARHSNTARDNVYDIVTKARIDNADNDASNDPAMLPRSLATIHQEVTALHLAKGVTDEEAIGSAVRMAQSETISNSIGTALSREDPYQAANILQEYGPMMAGKDKGAAYTAILESSTVSMAQEASDHIRDVAREEGWALAQQVEYARQTYSGRVRDQVVARLTGDDTARKSVAAEGRALASADRADLLFGQGQEDRDRIIDVDKAVPLLLEDFDTPEERQAALSRWERLNPEKYDATFMRIVKDKLRAAGIRELQEKELAVSNALTGAATAINQDRVPLDEYLAANPTDATLLFGNPAAYSKARELDNLRQHGDRFQPVSDGLTLHRIRQMTPKERLALNLETEPALTEVEFNEASRMQAMDQHAKGEEFSSTYAGVRRLLGRMVDKTYDYTSPGKQSANDRKYNQDITTVANLAVYDYIQENGKAPDEIDLTRIVSNAIQGVVVDNTGGLFGSGGILGTGMFSEEEVDFSALRTLSPDQIKGAKKSYDEIPLDMRNQIIALASGDGIRYVDAPPPEGVIEVAAAMWLIYDSDNSNKALAMARFKEVLGIN